jgi:monoterpene epsilon-lactone hydrolase
MLISLVNGFGEEEQLMASNELQTLINILRSQPKLSELGIEEQRAQMELGFTQFKVPPDVHCEPVDAGGVPAEWVTTPNVLPERVVYYLHGGGYVIGSINTHREMISRLSRAASARVLIIDYRLAPENPFPAALDDSVAAYRWLLSVGVDPARLVIAGESAGGGLTLATLVALRDAGEPLPRAGICISPWVDLEGLGESIVTEAETDLLVDRDIGLIWAKAYLGSLDPRTPLASPLYADLTGLPPLLVQIGTAELLFDDARRLADHARAAGVGVTLEPWDDMIHMWHFFAAMLPEGQQAIDRIGEFVREHT